MAQELDQRNGAGDYISRLLQARVSRRKLGGTGIALGEMLASACTLRVPFQTENTPTPEPPKLEPRYSLTSQERLERIREVKALKSAVEQMVQPSFYEPDYLEEILEASDTELVNFLKTGLQKGKDGSLWKLKFRSAEKPTSEIEAEISVSYQELKKLVVVRRALIGTNLANTEVPEFAQFIDNTSNKILSNEDSLKRVADAFFQLPEQIHWLSLYREPSIQSEVVGILGKFGTSDLTSPTVQLKLTTDGNADFSLFAPPIIIK